MVDKVVQIKTRMPTQLAEWVKQQAAANRRSQAAEIVHLIEQAKQAKGAA